MIKAGVIGWPVEHSKSPLIHRYWLKKYGISGAYDLYPITPDGLGEGVARLVDAGLAGFNVTLPHKQSIMNLCCSLTDTAQKIGAVNCVTIRSDGGLEGDNTDSYGFAQNVRETLPDLDLSGQSALVLGAGGAARAVIDALLTLGVTQIIITNRTPEKARQLVQQLAQQFSFPLTSSLFAGDGGMGAKMILPEGWEFRSELVSRADFIVNTTSLGMGGQPPLEIDLKQARERAVVADIVYTPLETDLLRQARAQGLRTVTGIGMLLHQARPAFAKWFGVRPEVDEELLRLVLP